MFYLLSLLVVPIVWPLIAKRVFKHEITLAEMAINIGAGVLVVLVCFYGGRYSAASDTQILNGEVVRKESQKVSCEHSYSCNCTQSCSGSGSSRSCITTCQTCYEHAYDIDHALFSTVGKILIAREDRRGTKVPERFQRAQIGDPVARADSHRNYIKAAPDSLFNKAAAASAIERFKDDIPAYPLAIYDYHYLNRVLPVKVKVPDLPLWNTELANALRKLGPSKEVNAVIVMTGHDSSYAEALEASWLGGKKNDVVIVLGTPSYPQIEWVRVLSWTDNQLFKVELRDALQALGQASAPAVVGTLAKHISFGFQRKSMKDFEYLKDAIEPPTWLLVLCFVFSVLVSVGTSIFLANNSYRGGSPNDRFRHDMFSHYRHRH